MDKYGKKEEDLNRNSNETSVVIRILACISWDLFLPMG